MTREELIEFRQQLAGWLDAIERGEMDEPTPTMRARLEGAIVAVDELIRRLPDEQD